MRRNVKSCYVSVSCLFVGSLTPGRTVSISASSVFDRKPGHECVHVGKQWRLGASFVGHCETDMFGSIQSIAGRDLCVVLNTIYTSLSSKTFRKFFANVLRRRKHPETITHIDGESIKFEEHMY